VKVKTVANKIKNNHENNTQTLMDKPPLANNLEPEKLSDQPHAQADSIKNTLSVNDNSSVIKYEMFDNMGIGGELL